MITINSNGVPEWLRAGKVSTRDVLLARRAGKIIKWSLILAPWLILGWVLR